MVRPWRAKGNDSPSACGRSRGRTLHTGGGPLSRAPHCSATGLSKNAEILLEQNDEWVVQWARYMTLETITPLSNTQIVGLAETAG
jgi:hypothetical protein